MKGKLKIEVNGEVVFEGENKIVEPESFEDSIVPFWIRELEKNPKRKQCIACSGHGYYYFEPGRWKTCERCNGLGSVKQ